MKLMVKGGVKRWIPDVFIGYYRDLGYTVEGEETPSHDPEEPDQVTPVDPEEPQENADLADQDDEQPGETGEDEQPDAAPEAAMEEADPVFTCPHCGKEYNTESALKGHITRSHSGEQ